MLGLHLDRRRAGTHYSDRMHRILGVCHAMGILWHEERVQYREGVSEVHRMEDVRPEGSVLVTPQYEKYGLTVNPRVLSRLKGMAPQLAYALNVANVAVEVAGDVVYVRVPRECGAGDGVVLFEQAWALAPDLGLCLLLGIDEDQKQFILDLKAHNNVHAAVIGMTGSGKSTLMKTMLLSAQMTGGSKIALFDPSGGFQALSGHPSVWRSGLFRRAEDCEIGLEILARGLHRVRLSVEEGPGGRPAVAVRAWRPYGNPITFDPLEQEPHFISGTVLGLNCRVAWELEDGQWDWLDEWEDELTNCLPLAVEITVFMEAPDPGEPPVELQRTFELPAGPLSWIGKTPPL